ncbi:Uncharacterised protein [Chlamydia abortus]|nr:Uncharacterised protein [Chlamydia abortus]
MYIEVTKKSLFRLFFTFERWFRTFILSKVRTPGYTHCSPQAPQQLTIYCPRLSFRELYTLDFPVFLSLIFMPANAALTPSTTPATISVTQ